MRKRPSLAGERGGPGRQITAIHLLLAATLLVFFADWGCAIWSGTPAASDASGNTIRLITPLPVKQYLERAPGVGQPDDN